MIHCVRPASHAPTFGDPTFVDPTFLEWNGAYCKRTVHTGSIWGFLCSDSMGVCLRKQPSERAIESRRSGELSFVYLETVPEGT